MFIVNSYILAVVLCFVTMICWGSWGNTQKLAAKNWRYEFFYWDYVIGILLFSVFMAYTFGSFGEVGHSFCENVRQVSVAAFVSAIIGGIIFNASNILLSASISLSGMSVAFPVGVGLALVLGVTINYFGQPKGNAWLLFIGVALIMVAIIVNGIASGRQQKGGGTARKGIVLAIVAGVLMSFFYRFVAVAMDLNNFENPEVGKATPYTAFVIFALGIFLSNFLFNTLAMKHPFVGLPVSYRSYFAAPIKVHSVGFLGGVIWGLGTILSYLAAGKAGAAISYALGQGAPMIAAFWGVFVWKEFKGSDRISKMMLTMMFACFLIGLGIIVGAGK